MDVDVDVDGKLGREGEREPWEKEIRAVSIVFAFVENARATPFKLLLLARMKPTQASMCFIVLTLLSMNESLRACIHQQRMYGRYLLACFSSAEG